VVEKTKFRKSRLLPVHPSTRRALDDYLAVRLRVATENAALLIGNTGEAVAYPTVIAVFLRLTRSIGLCGSSDHGGPRNHDLRHNSESRIIPRVPRWSATKSLAFRAGRLDRDRHYQRLLRNAKT
jgi:site-specific recombinase XerC